MDTLIHADIFFFITTIAVVVGAILVSVILIYLIMIFRDLKSISSTVKQETELIAMDIDEAREHIKKQGADFGSIFKFLKRIFKRK
jgi:hypothetical protein